MKYRDKEIPDGGKRRKLRNKFGAAKLRDKMTAGMLFILLTAMYCCCIFLITNCRKAMIQNVRLYAEQEMKDFCDTLVSQTAKLSAANSISLQR